MKRILYSSIACVSLVAPSFAIDNKSHDSFWVSEHNGDCAAGGQTILCSEIASLLENLGIRKDRLITVSASGLDHEAYERALNVAAMIRAGGWKNVSVVGMVTN